jgi:hypothetical protein
LDWGSAGVMLAEPFLLEGFPRYSPNTYAEVISMNHTYKVLKSDNELFAAALSQVRVYVVQLVGKEIVEIIDYGGVVERFSSESVKISGKYYMRGSLSLE